MSILVLLFVLFCLFPYLDLFGLGTDTQPNALIISIAILSTLKNKSINTPLILLWLLAGCSIFLFFFNEGSTFQFAKNTLNYFSMPFLAMCSYLLFKRNKLKVSYNFFLSVLSIYAFVGLTQQYIHPNFGITILNELRGIMVFGRGVASLCPEPAFYGSQCLFFLVFSILQYNKKQNLVLIPFILGQMFLLSRSATAVAIFAAAISLFTVVQILRFKIIYMLYAVVFLAISIPIYKSQIQKLEETRAGQIAAEFIEDPLMATQIDASVGVRFTGAVAPFLSVKNNYFMPMGLGHYKTFLKDLYQRGLHRNFLTPQIVNEKDKLGGSMNAVLFQLGFIGLLFPLALFLCYRRRLREDKYIFSMILFYILLFTQIQLMHSMIGFLLGYVLYKSKTKDKEIPVAV